MRTYRAGDAGRAISRSVWCSCWGCMVPRINSSIIRGVCEVYDTLAIFGIWDHKIEMRAPRYVGLALASVGPAAVPAWEALGKEGIFVQNLELSSSRTLFF